MYKQLYKKVYTCSICSMLTAYVFTANSIQLILTLVSHELCYINLWSDTITIKWRCFSYTVVFLYLLDEQTSLLVLVPAGIPSVIVCV